MSALLNARLPNKGIWSKTPAFQPKYTTSDDAVAAAYANARLYVPFTDQTSYKAWLDEIQDVNGREIAAAFGVIEGGSGGSYGYIDFGVTNVAWGYVERVQITETVGDAAVFYGFGGSPVQLSVQGVLYNTRQDNWLDAMHYAWTYVLRASAAARSRTVVHLHLGSHLLQVVGMSYQPAVDSSMEMRGQFSMSFGVLRQIVLRGADNTRPTDLAQLGPAPQRVLDEQQGASQLIELATESENNILIRQGLFGAPTDDAMRAAVLGEARRVGVPAGQTFITPAVPESPLATAVRAAPGTPPPGEALAVAVARERSRENELPEPAAAPPRPAGGAAGSASSGGSGFFTGPPPAQEHARALNGDRRYFPAGAAPAAPNATPAPLRRAGP